METKEAISILGDELKHCRQHLQFKGKEDAYYKELGDLVSALEIAILALNKQEVDDG